MTGAKEAASDLNFDLTIRTVQNQNEAELIEILNDFTQSGMNGIITTMPSKNIENAVFNITQNTNISVIIIQTITDNSSHALGALTFIGQVSVKQYTPY